MSKPGRRELAIRRLFTDGKGGLNADAKVLIADFRRFCHADSRGLLKYNPRTGELDASATVAAAARREIYDRYQRFLYVDISEILTAHEDDQ